MIKIGICDDEKYFADMMSVLVSDFFRAAKTDATVTSETNPSAFQNRCITDPFDVVFLDIDMPDVTGFEISKLIRDTHPKTVIIYVSAMQELVFKSFEYHPFYFICKSDHLELKEKINIVGQKLLNDFVHLQPVTVTTRDGNTVTKTLDEIAYVKSDGHYVSFYLTDGTSLEERGALNNRLQKMPDGCFVRVHNQFAVNLFNVSHFTFQKKIIVLKNNAEIPVGRSYADRATEAYLSFIRKNV